MAAASNIAAGGRILAAAIRGVAPLSAYKGADQSVSSNNPFVADTDLHIPLAANSRYIVIGMLAFSAAGSNVGDLIATFAWPSGATGMISGWGVVASATATPAGAGNTTVGNVVTTPGVAGGAPAGAYQVYGGKGTGAGQLAPAYLMCSVQTSSTAGDLQLLWAQHVASGTPTTVKAGSVLAAWQTQ